MEKTALKIIWSDSEEFIRFDFTDLYRNTGLMSSVERWPNSGTVIWAKYLMSSELFDGGDFIQFKLTYKKGLQTDKWALKYSTWGVTTIVFDKLKKTWSARWDDDLHKKNNGEASIAISDFPTIPVDNEAPSVSTTPKNKLSFTKFLKSLGCTLRLGFYWSAKSDDSKRIIFTIWADRLEGDRYMLLPPDDAYWSTLPGAYEVQKHIPFALSPDTEVFGVLCHAKDEEVSRRERSYYDDTTLLVLSIEQEGKAAFARIRGEVSVSRAKSERIMDHGSPRTDTENDIENTPEGVEHPERIFGSSSGFARDRMVRNHVLQRANGHCEHCGKMGFELPDGRRYLEAHHIVALSKNGADTPRNVIALCASDHREAHYVAKWKEMNEEMMRKLDAVFGPK